MGAAGEFYSPDLTYGADSYMGGTRSKYKPWKVRIHTQNASQRHFYCFLKDIWILKSSCSLKSPTHALIWCPFHPCVTAGARKRPQSFCQKYRWQVTPKHTYALDPTKSEWADYLTVQAQCGNLSRNELTCILSGNIWPQSSLLTEPLWTDPDIMSGVGVR